MKKVITAAILAVIAPRWTTSTASDTAPPGLYRSIVYDIYAALDLARNPALHLRPEWMRELAQHEHTYIRENLAENPAIGQFPEVVRILGGDGN